MRGNLEVFTFLLESDCDKEHYNGAGENTLHKACQVGSLDAVRLLIAAGAKKNKAAVRSNPVNSPVLYSPIDSCRLPCCTAGLYQPHD